MENRNSVQKPDFETSKLGTKDFWEDSFKKDLEIYKERKEIDDIWFGQESVDRVVRWMEDNDIDKSSRILDIGCGNGASLLSLAEKGYINLWGIDYSSSAIELSKTICADQNRDVHYQVCDFLQELPTNIQNYSREGDTTNINTEKKSIMIKNAKDEANKNKLILKTEDNFLRVKYDVCLDKGTFDAVCLNPNNRNFMRDRYKENIIKICNDDAIFILTSCNWTKCELIKHFSSDFDLVHQIPSKSFQFGGVVGHCETVLVLKIK